MDARGWGWTASDVRQARLIEWLAEHSAGRANVYVEVKEFYEGLADQTENRFEIAHADLKLLEEQRFITQASGVGGIESMAAMLTAQGHERLERLRARRMDKVQRRAASRDAMIAWLYSVDATNDAVLPVRDLMLADARHGTWLAEPFSAADLADASTWLHSNGLIAGITIDQDPGPIRLHLTSAGVACAEGFDSHADRYLASRLAASAGAPTINIGSNNGQLQVAGDHAHQVQTVSASADEIRQLVLGIAEIVRVLMPGATGVDEYAAEALSAVASDGSADRSVLERFGKWAVSTATAGTTSGVVAVISSAVTALLMRLGHIG